MELFFLIPVCILSACLPKPIDLELPLHQARLVVASQIVPEKEMVVALTYSFSPLSRPTDNDTVVQEFLDKVVVKNGFVTVSYLGQTDTLLPVEPGVYSSNLKLKYDYGTYSLNVTDDSTKLQIAASSVMLPRIFFDTVYPAVKRGAADSSVQIHYAVRDTPGIDNWYVISYFSKSKLNEGASLDIYEYFNKGSNKLNQIELLTDKMFVDGKYADSRTLLNVSTYDTIAVVLSNISKGYFEFLTAYQKSGNVLNQITGEPINFPTNIANGYGYFNTHNPDARIFMLKFY